MKIFNTLHCTGCRACELACSFHHLGEFSPHVAGIHIRGNHGKGEIYIALYEQDEGTHVACDCPKGKEFCLRFCPVIAREELKRILDQRCGVFQGVA